MTITVECSTVFFQDYNANADKQYRVYVVGDWAVFQWGRRSVVGQFKATKHGSPSAAAVACRNQLATKMAEGYSGRVDDTFDYNQAFMDGSKSSCTQLDDIRQAACGTTVASSSPTAAPSTPVPVATSDPYGDFTARALAAISLAVTDPRKGATEYAILNAAWPELEQIHAKAQSYLKTLDSLVIGVTA